MCRHTHIFYSICIWLDFFPSFVLFDLSFVMSCAFFLLLLLRYNFLFFLLNKNHFLYTFFALFSVFIISLFYIHGDILFLSCSLLLLLFCSFAVFCFQFFLSVDCSAFIINYTAAASWFLFRFVLVSISQCDFFLDNHFAYRSYCLVTVNNEKKLNVCIFECWMTAGPTYDFSSFTVRFFFLSPIVIYLLNNPHTIAWNSSCVTVDNKNERLNEHAHISFFHLVSLYRCCNFYGIKM